ncbi:hypothetical protein EVJ58_g1387 [Rhodofomes roseus]|uniref:Uncharacterized protein n=1 Tax=Rhodofomes roseus TaxID=34475 RepID=A0A4Y9YYX9_9APHY|nr:hypothetical protein EVJ58_g1387 [Rhodofomes roseus]
MPNYSSGLNAPYLHHQGETAGYLAQASPQQSPEWQPVFSGSQTQQIPSIQQQDMLSNETNMTEYQHAMPFSAAFYPGIQAALDLIDPEPRGLQEFIAEVQSFRREAETRERLARDEEDHAENVFWYFGCTTAWTPTYTTRQALDRPDVPAPTSGYNVATAFPVLPASATREIVNIPEGWIDDDIVETSTTLDEQEVSSDVSSASSAQTSEMWRVLEQEQEEAFHASLRQLTACNALSELRRETLAEHASSEGELVSPY